MRIAITPPYLYPGEADAITDILESGIFDIVHIRKHGASETDIIRLIEGIPPASRARLTLHNFHHLAQSLGCGGIHGPNVDAEGTTLRRSCSCHSLDELLNLPADIDYAFLSPIFPSFSKPGYSSAIIDTPNLADILAQSKVRVVALGGVTADSFRGLLSLGFSGAALLSEAWRSPAITPDRFLLQLISHPITGRSMADEAREAFAGGCRWIQLRHKGADAATILAESREINALPSRPDFTFILDDHVDLVIEAGADGVHLGKNDMPVAEARLRLGPGKIIGATANTLDDILTAARDGADYIGLGPFRFTTTKERLSPTLGLDGIRDIISTLKDMKVRIPVVVIGGITPADCRDILGAGAQGVAVSGAILSTPDPVAATRSFIDKLSLNIS